MFDYRDDQVHFGGQFSEKVLTLSILAESPVDVLRLAEHLVGCGAQIEIHIIPAAGPPLVLPLKIDGVDGGLVH